MRIASKTGSAAVAVAALLLLAGCSVKVSEGDQGAHSDVDIRTPLAQISVGGAEDGAATGLPVYPGAELSSRGDGRESANVDIGTAWFGVKVVAAEYETDDQPRQILEFYRDAMSRYGEVTECRGDVKFRGPKGDRRPVCREDMFARDLKLVVGTEHRQRIVAIKPRADYTEFAVVYIATRPD